MGRTESVSFQVHPNDEQEQINLMQKFCWNLLGSQEIKTIDNHLERRGDDIYQVTSSQHYVKLTFSRELETPNLPQIREIENDYFSLKPLVFPALFPGGFLAWILLCLFCLVGFIAWPLYYFLSFSPKTAAAKALSAQQETKRQELMQRLAQYT
jgi:hypothetical protein